MSVDVKQRHEELHKAFDELFACYIGEHPEMTQFLASPLEDFMEWSHQMTLNPTCQDKHKPPCEHDFITPEDTERLQWGTWQICTICKRIQDNG